MWYPTPPPSFLSEEFLYDELEPASEYPGGIITLNGTNFSGATRILFNGTSATFTNSAFSYAPFEDFRLFATVPPGATAGPITIETTHGNATSSVIFTPLVLPKLSIRSLPGNLIELSWPETEGFYLEHTASLQTSPPWAAPQILSNSLSGGGHFVTVTNTFTNDYFRVRR
jgi:hypothetical protein